MIALPRRLGGWSAWVLGCWGAGAACWAGFADRTMEGEGPEKGLERLTEVIVAGTFRKDEAGNLRLEAERMSMQ